MSVNIEDDVVDVISCVALFYEKGMSGNSGLRKEKFRAQLPRKEETLRSARKTVRYVLAARVKLRSKEYIFQYLLSTIVLDFMGFPFHEKDKFDVEVTIEEG